MFKLRTPIAAAALGFAVGLGPTSGHAQDIEVLVALPATTLTFSSAFLAEDAGFYKKEGLKVSHRTIVGVGSPNAVIAGAADFTIGTGPVFLRAAASGQRLFAIANLIDRPLVEMVLRLHESVYAPLYALFLVGPAANLVEIWWHARQSTGASASTPDLLA